METYNQHIELINDYLNDRLSAESKVDFETKLQNDTDLKAIYDEHFVFLGGLNRIVVREEIQKAKQSYHNEKWLKITGISIVILGAIVMLFTLVFNTSETEPTPNNDNFNTIISDSVANEKTEIDTIIQISEEKIDTITTASETEVRYTTTTINEKFGVISTTRMDLIKRAQRIRFNSQNDTTIRCEEGTILKIAKSSFIDAKTGKPITGNIDLKVTEYYKLSDILLANLSTLSNDKQLETGGMLYIEAFQNSTDLKLKPNATIDISFPTTNKKADMQLFSGEWNEENINWTLQNDILEELNIDAMMTDEIIEENIDVPFSVVDQTRYFLSCIKHIIKFSDPLLPDTRITTARHMILVAKYP